MNPRFRSGSLLTPVALVNRVAPVLDQVLEDIASPPADPAAAMWENEEQIHLEFDLPGVAEQDLDITVHGKDLLVRAERRRPEAARGIDSRSYGRFEHRVRLNAPVDLNRIQASLASGILSIDLPKSEAAKPFKVALRSPTLVEAPSTSAGALAEQPSPTAETSPATA